MSNRGEQLTSSKPARPSAGITVAGGVGSKRNSSSKPDSLLGSSVATVTAETRRTMIAEAAYYIAEQRGFECGREVEDWLLAVKQIDTALSS